MMRAMIILLALFGLILVSTTASAIRAKPGTDIALVYNDFEVTTDTPILPDWKPETVRWKLIDPHGETKVIKDTNIDSITKKDSGFLATSSKWNVNTNGGFITIPAFAEPGEWKIQAMFYSKDLIFLNKEGYDYTYVTVEEGSVTDNLMSPVGFIMSIPIIGDFYIGLEIIYIIGIVLIVPLLWMVFRRKKVK